MFTSKISRDFFGRASKLPKFKMWLRVRFLRLKIVLFCTGKIFLLQEGNKTKFATNQRTFSKFFQNLKNMFFHLFFWWQNVKDRAGRFQFFLLAKRGQFIRWTLNKMLQWVTKMSYFHLSPFQLRRTSLVCKPTMQATWAKTAAPKLPASSVCKLTLLS